MGPSTWFLLSQWLTFKLLCVTCLLAKPTLPETNIAPENGWLEDDPFLFGIRPIFRGENVSFREGMFTDVYSKASELQPQFLKKKGMVRTLKKVYPPFETKISPGPKVCLKK